MTESVSTITQVVNTHDSEKIGLNHDETSPIIDKVNTHTWPERFEKLISQDGYNTGKQIIRCLPINEWIGKTNALKTKVSMFFDGQAFYNSVNVQNLFVDFTKFKHSPLVQEPISYFSLYPPNNSKVHKLYSLLKKEGYYIETKPLPADTRRQVSITPEMIVRIMYQVYDSEQPITHVLITAQDHHLIPMVQHLRNMGIITTVAIAKTQTLSNYFISQFHHVINLIDLIKHSDAIFDRHSNEVGEA